MTSSPKNSNFLAMIIASPFRSTAKGLPGASALALQDSTKINVGRIMDSTNFLTAFFVPPDQIVQRVLPEAVSAIRFG
jgi:hypothetical protein